MNYKQVEAGKGIEWISQAVQLPLTNPGVFLVMAIIMALISIVPFASAIIGPALLGGFIYAYREQEQGRTPEIGNLFQAFQQPGKIGPMLMLCLPSLAAGIIGAVVLFLTIGAALASLGVASANHAGAAGMGIGIGALVGALVIIVLSLAAFALVVFAIPRVMLDNIEPVAAMKESLDASIANLAALLVFCLVSGLIVLCLGLVFVVPIIGPLVWMFATYAYFSAALYVMYREIFGVAALADAELPPPPAPPQAPPPPPA